MFRVSAARRVNFEKKVKKISSRMRYINL